MSPRGVKGSGKRKGKSTRSKPNPKKGKKFDEAAFCKKYSHVVSGSVREVKAGSKVDGIVAAHGRICKVKCKCGKTRTINVQDAFQVKLCLNCQAKSAKERAASRRKKKAS